MTTGNAINLEDGTTSNSAASCCLPLIMMVKPDKPIGVIVRLISGYVATKIVMTLKQTVGCVIRPWINPSRPRRYSPAGPS